VASSKTRARKLAREKLDRQLARRAESERRARRIRAGVGAFLAVALIALGGTWLLGGFDKKATPAAEPQQCYWSEQNVEANPDFKNVGQPAVRGLPDSGASAMTVNLKGGDTIRISLDQAAAPCAAASLTYLANKAYYTDTPCFELKHSDNTFSLRCGDHSGSGKGGPSYVFNNELTEPVAEPAPTASAAATPSSTAAADGSTVTLKAGTVAMLPNVSGSQFVIFYQDSIVPKGTYSLVGHVTAGLDAVKKIAAAGTVANANGEDTKPKNDVVIQSLTVVDVSDVDANPSAAATPTAAATPSVAASKS
jgi:peptidyl-prolyl cis-trans isomerase B (cyclophilin B)